MIQVYIPSLKKMGFVDPKTNRLTWKSKSGRLIDVDANCLNWISEPLTKEVPQWK